MDKACGAVKELWWWCLAGSLASDGGAWLWYREKRSAHLKRLSSGRETVVCREFHGGDGDGAPVYGLCDIGGGEVGLLTGSARERPPTTTVGPWDSRAGRIPNCQTVSPPHPATTYPCRRRRRCTYEKGKTIRVLLCVHILCEC